ncbi:MAG TPA: nucleotide exchange factor GrpE [Solirubrobacterales bacterium]|nr:nucleotide exchange factor GrpE [Solirubrobacterales bacterium]
MAETATVQIQMPEMGESVTEGIVLEWHVAVGDFVKEGDTVVEVSTDKVDAEVPAPADGTITKLLVEVDDEVPVGAPLAEMAPGEGPAGPVAAGNPPPPAVAEASSGAVPPTPPPAGDAEEVEADFEALLEGTKRERDEYLELAKRTKADFENYRKRMAAETQAALGRGKGELARDVVPVLDDLERAIEAAGLDPEGDSEDGLAHGVLLVFRGLRETLQRQGVEVVDPKGERFDPHAHEALSTVKADGTEAGTVVEVLQKGYRLGEQLIRPARVVVAE